MNKAVAALAFVILGTATLKGADTRLILPPDVALLKARLIVQQDSYTLDPSQQGAVFRKKLREAPQQGGQGIQIQPGQIQIQAVPMPMPVPAPNKARALPGKRLRRAVPAKKPLPADAKETEKKEDGAKEAAEGEKKEKEADDVKVEGDVQGVIVVSNGQGNVEVKTIAPGPPVKEDKKPDDTKGEKKETKEDKEKKEQPNVQAFNIQAQGGQIQIQGRIQVQGGVPGGPAQVQIFVLGGPQRPLPPAVDMDLEVTNTSGQEMTLLVGGGRSQLDLALDGPGAITIEDGGAVQVEAAREIKLAPGAVHKVPVKRLQHGQNGRSASYWTEPGQYTLKATYKAQIKSSREGGKDTPIEVTAPAVKMEVVEKK